MVLLFLLYNSKLLTTFFGILLFFILDECDFLLLYTLLNDLDLSYKESILLKSSIKFFSSLSSLYWLFLLLFKSSFII
jgi:hypothetical protein